MEVSAALVVFAIGLGVGVVAGLIGIGGGVVIVPFLYFFYGHPEWFGVVVSAEDVVVVSHATSLFVIVPTALRGAWVYQRARLIVWRAAVPIGVASLLAAVLGAWLAVLLPGAALQAGFGALLLASGIRLGRGGRAAVAGIDPLPMRLSLPVTLPTGAATGLLSALMGVGGGIVSMPLMAHVMRVDVRRLAATSMGIIAMTAPAGVVAYMLMNHGSGRGSPWSMGYVDIGVGVVMFLGSILSVHLGARLNQRMNAPGLSLLFAITFMVLGVYLFSSALR